MKVFNLTQGDINYRGKVLPANGGSQEYPELDKGFIPNRDRDLEKFKVLAFGTLPSWWTREQAVKLAVFLPTPGVPDANGSAFTEKGVEQLSAQLTAKGFTPMKHESKRERQK